MNKMTRALVAIAVLGGLLASAACAGTGDNRVQASGPDLGLIPIGGIPQDMGIFVSTDCDKLQPKFADCSARDREGREYVFFDGALSRVSVSESDATENLRLPGGVEFGEDIASVAMKVHAVYGVQLKRNMSDERIIYSSGYVARSSTGVLYSIELSGDGDGRLIEFVQRTDF